MPRRSACCTAPWPSRQANRGTASVSRGRGSTGSTGVRRPDAGSAPSPPALARRSSGQRLLLELLDLPRGDPSTAQQLFPLRDLVGALPRGGDVADAVVDLLRGGVHVPLPPLCHPL